jgi:DNA-binding SARP family transcriptional activator
MDLQETGGNYVFEIYTLGKFEVYSQGTPITEINKRSIRMWKLFKYFIANRRKMLSPGELIEFVWGEQNCENPEKALQNLIYRIRQTLSLNAPADDLILFTQGCYKWNEKIAVWIDCDALTEHGAKGREHIKTSINDARNHLEKLLELYNGDFLSDIIYDLWVVPMRIAYKKIYTDGVMLLLEILEELEDFEGVIKVCGHLFNYEFLDERANIYFLKALAALNKKQEAQRHYNKVTDMMYREMGVRPSKEFAEIARKLQEQAAVATSSDSKNISLDYINNMLWTDEKLPGAFYCDKETFIAISKFMLRNLDRSGMFVTMALATFAENIRGEPEDGEYNLDSRRVIEIIEKSSELILKNLRKGDALCRWNSYQVLIMFANLSHEDAELAMDRFKNMIQADVLKQDYDMYYEIAPISHAAD